MTTIPVGKAPWGVATDPASHTTYVTNHSSGTVSVIDEATNRVTHTIRLAVGSAPQGVAVDANNGTVWVADNDGTVSVIGEDRHKVLTTLNLGRYGFDPASVAVDAPAHMVYVGLWSGSIVGISDQSYAIQPIYTSHGTTHIFVGSVNPRADTLYASAWDTSSVIEVNLASNGSAGSVATLIGLGPVPDPPSVDPAHGHLYVGMSCPGCHRIVVFKGINTGAGEAWKTIQTPRDTTPLGAAFDDATNTAFVSLARTNSSADGSALIIDGATSKVIATVAVGRGPMGAAISVDPGQGAAGTVYVANSFSNTVTAFEPPS
jgi:YVTN family beta-propeller protein